MHSDLNAGWRFSAACRWGESVPQLRRVEEIQLKSYLKAKYKEKSKGKKSKVQCTLWR